MDLATLGVEPIINANTTQTRLGGSLMPEPVLEAMTAAAREFTDLEELLAAAGRRLAVLTRNEAAYVTAGAATGLVLAALATMTGADPVAVQRKADGRTQSLERDEIITQVPQRTPYERAFSLAGARVVQIGSLLGTSRLELEAAITARTAAIAFFAGHHLATGSLPLEEVLDIGRAAGIPVIVDAAAQLPPSSNLWAYTDAGAALAIFSGGKGLRGPAPSGLVVGRADLIEACALHGYPHQRLGRPMKVGKEEIVGLVAAVEWFLAQDHEAAADRIERATQAWISALDGFHGVQARRDYPGEAGRPVSRAVVEWESGPTGMDVRAALLNSRPRVDVAVAGARSIHLNAELLSDEQVKTVLARLISVLKDLGVAAARAC